MAKKERVKHDFRLNPDNIKVNDWVFSGGDIGFVESIATDTETMLQFMVVWNNEPPAVPVLAENLKKLNRPVSVGGINYTIALDLLVLSPELQQRVKLDSAVVEEYAEAYRNHVKFPPITIWYRTDVEYKGTPLLHPAYLIDGFHRVEAARIAGITELPFIRKQGTFREALLYSTSINSTHGLRRSNADKRKSVMTLLQDPEWSQWSDREIGRRCRVNHKTVGKVRATLTGEIPSGNQENHEGNLTGEIPSGNQESHEEVTRTYITKDGVEATMRIGNIGKSNSRENPDPAPEFNDGGFFPEENYPEDNHYYPEDVIKDLWDDDDDSVSEDSVNEDSVSNNENNEDKPKNPNPTSPYSSKHNKPNNIKRPQKKEIILREGLNYFIRESEDKCRWYVELDKEIYEGLKIYQERVQAMSVNAGISRFLENEGILLRPFPENKIIDEKLSAITLLNSENRNKLEGIVEKHGVDAIFKMFPE